MAAPIIVSWVWDFGDGTFSWEQNPEHLYKMAGTYNVTLTVIDDSGQTAQITEVIYVYDWSYSGGMNAAKTDMCLRLATPQEPGQGIGWSIYDDVYNGERTYEYPFPPSRVGSVIITDDDDEPRVLVVDSNTYRIYELGRDDHWQDGGDDNYAGVNIEAEVTYREHVAPVRANAKLKHSQYRFYLKPWFKDRRNDGQYDANGFREGNEVDLYIRVDGEPGVFATAREVPLDGQVVFDRHIISPYLQPGAIVRVAPWRIAHAEGWYSQIDKGAEPPLKLMSEMDWQLEYEGSVFWVGRDRLSPVLDRSTATDCGGSIAGTVEGPDGYAGSALRFGAGDSLTVADVGTMEQDFSMHFWFRSPGDATTTIFQFATGALSIQIVIVAGSYMLRWTDGTQTLDFDISGKLTSWTQFTVVKLDDNVMCYQDGVLLGTVEMTDEFITYGGQLTVGNDNCLMIDMRIIPRAVSADASLYFYRDMSEYNGNVTCPNW